MAEHPYRGAPNRSFWSRSVARDFTVESVPDRPGFKLTVQDRFMSAGSCFSANIARYLRGWGYNYVVTEHTHPQWPEGAESGFYDAYSARYGNIYTARQMVQLLERVTGTFHPDEECWTTPEGQVIDPFRPGLNHRASSILEYRALTAQHLRAVRSAIEDSTVLIFTLGLTEAWISLSDGAVFPACPGTVAGEFDPDRHGFVNYTVQDVVLDLHQMIDLVRSIQPHLKIILTVSPVPLVATATTHHVLAATIYSKSVLRVAAQQTTDTHQDISYFPAYEIVTGPHHHDSPFEPDLRTVREPIIAVVMNSFHSAFFQDRVESLPVSATVSKPDFTDMISEAISAQCEEMLADEQLGTSHDLPLPATGATPT